MATVGLYVDAVSATVGLTRGARDFTLTGRTNEAVLAYFATFSTVLAVGLEIHTGSATVGLTGGTANLTLPVGADLTGRTGVSTATAVVTIVLVVNTLAVADSLAGQARDNALTALTNFTVVASSFTGATVFAVSLEVVASTLAFGLSSGTVDGACTVTTDFTLLTLRATSTTVFAVVRGIDTNIVAIGLTFGAVGLHTLALVTVVLTGTIFDFGTKLKASTSILYTNLVLAGDFRSLGRAIKVAFFALRVRTIGNTFVVFTLFEVFADSPTFALAPHTTLTFLGPLDAGFAIGRQATLGVARSTLHTLVIHTSRCRFVGAIFVFEALHTAASTVALFPSGTIFVSSTNAFVVFGTFLCGTCVSLTVNILQARNTSSLGGRTV